MAAGALFRNRGVAGVQTTKGLYFIFTLLCLVCLSSSLTKKEKLEKAKRLLKSAQIYGDKIKKLKSYLDFNSEMTDARMRLLEPMSAMIKKTEPDFLPLVEIMEKIKTLAKISKSYSDKRDEKMAADIKHNEEKQRKLKQLIKHFEENQYEL